MPELIYPDPNAPRLTSVEVIGDYAVRVVFSDGEIREADLTRNYVYPNGKLIGDPAAFARVCVHQPSDTLLWPDDDYHVHGEMLYERLYRAPIAASS